MRRLRPRGNTGRRRDADAAPEQDAAARWHSAAILNAAAGQQTVRTRLTKDVRPPRPAGDDVRGQCVMEFEGKLFVVDDDPIVRESVQRILRSVGLTVQAYGSAVDFLAEFDIEQAGCLLLDIRMPGMDGLELQQELAARGATIPIIFITGYGEVTTAVRALRKGALEFLEKPFGDQALLDAVRRGIEVDRVNREKRAREADLAERVSRLTPREREVVELVVAGKPNKAIARELGVRDKTVEFHRANFMKKLEVDCLADLLRLVLGARDPYESLGSRPRNGQGQGQGHVRGHGHGNGGNGGNGGASRTLLGGSGPYPSIRTRWR
jgi:two-component system response regulator FixJ